MIASNIALSVSHANMTYWIHCILILETYPNPVILIRTISAQSSQAPTDPNGKSLRKAFRHTVVTAAGTELKTAIENLNTLPQCEA